VGVLLYCCVYLHPWALRHQLPRLAPGVKLTVARAAYLPLLSSERFAGSCHLLPHMAHHCCSLMPASLCPTAALPAPSVKPHTAGLLPLLMQAPAEAGQLLQGGRRIPQRLQRTTTSRRESAAGCLSLVVSMLQQEQNQQREPSADAAAAAGVQRSSVFWWKC
jgi:hypothetical protein